MEFCFLVSIGKVYQSVLHCRSRTLCASPLKDLAGFGSSFSMFYKSLLGNPNLRRIAGRLGVPVTSFSNFCFQTSGLPKVVRLLFSVVELSPFFSHTASAVSLQTKDVASSFPSFGL